MRILLKIYKWFQVLLILASLNTYGQKLDSLKHKKKWHERNLFKSVRAPLVLSSAGLLLAIENPVFDKYDFHEAVRDRYPNFSSSLDDYLRYVPPALAFAIEPFGIKAKNKWSTRAYIFVKANVFALSLTFPLKGITGVRRPNDKSSASMPSLHTAQAFLGAQLLHREYGHHSIAISIAGYSMASITGLYRVLNNKHWISDVFVGAAIGIFSTELSYLTQSFFKTKRRKKNFKAMILPKVSHESFGGSIVLSFR